MNQNQVRLSCGCTEYDDMKPISFKVKNDSKTYHGTFCSPCIEKYKRNPDIDVLDKDGKDERIS